MNLSQAVLLAVIQGVTEFLPVSSSGHLALAQNILGLIPPVGFDILVHLGTLMAVVWYFRHRLGELWRNRRQPKTQRYIGLYLIGTLPVVAVGLILQPYLDRLFGSLLVVGLGLVMTGFFLEVWGKERRPEAQLTRGRALVIGAFQALALIPGISRSGATISSGLRLGLSRRQAFEFSFLLAIPATLGAVVLGINQLNADGFLFSGLVGLVVSVLVGFLALGWLERVLGGQKLKWFGRYCFGIGLLVTVFSLAF